MPHVTNPLHSFSRASKFVKGTQNSKLYLLNVQRLDSNTY